MQMVELGGLEALSINKLADAVDYTPGALYRYFDSKDALLSRLVERVLGELRAHLIEELARVSEPARPLDRVFALVTGFCEFATRAPHRFGLLAMTLADPRVLLVEASDVAPVAAVMMAALQPLAQAMDDAAAEGQLQPGDVIERTLCVFALLQGMLQMRKQARRAPVPLDVEQLAMQGTRALLLGWGASPESLAHQRTHTVIPAQRVPGQLKQARKV